MIQLKVADPGDVLVSNNFYLDVYNEMNEGQDSGRSLCTFTSQFTKKSKTVSLNTGYADNNSRYIQYGVFTTRNAGEESLLTGVMQLGTTDFPLGFYDVILYNNTDNTNLDPTGLNVLWNGVMNLSGDAYDSKGSVEYTEYNENDNYVNIINLTNPL